jgi:hypothetical protein
MDLNHLYQRQQVALFMAERATSASSRAAHLGLAEGYAEMIASARTAPRKAVAQ